MSINTEKYKQILQKIQGKATLVAVSKIRSVDEIMTLYKLGQRDFGENYVQELFHKQERLPTDIRWHFIGHLQTNKVKYIASFVHLIQAVDSFNLLKEINKQALKNNRTIDCLLQIHIAAEQTKFGFSANELDAFFTSDLPALKNIRITGLMGMATFSDDMNLVRTEFKILKTLFEKYTPLLTNAGISPILSMGMSDDYETALLEGSNMIRIGSLLFGQRN